MWKGQDKAGETNMLGSQLYKTPLKCTLIKKKKKTKRWNDVREPLQGRFLFFLPPQAYT